MNIYFRRQINFLTKTFFNNMIIPAKVSKIVD